MIKLVWVALILGIAVWLGVYVDADPGIVIIRVAGYRIDLPLWLTFLLGFVVFVIIYYCLKLYDSIKHSKNWLADFNATRKKQRARKLTHSGFIELAEGDWHRAERHLLQAAKDSDVPLLNYLSAAKAAQELGEAKRRDHYLKLAHDTTKGADIAIGLTQARLQYQQGQFEQSLATVKHLATLAPFHPHILKLLKNIYLQLKDWEQLLTLLPNLRKHKVISQEEEKQLEQQLYCQLIQQAVKQPDQDIDAIWQKTPKRLHADTELACVYGEWLQTQARFEEAELVLRHAIKRELDDASVLQYGLIQQAEPQKALDIAEGWLRSHQDSPTLLLTLGRLSMQAQLWGKAQRYLEACLKLKPMPEAYAELAILLEKVNQSGMAKEYYKKGLMASVPHELASLQLGTKLLESNQVDEQ